MDTNRLLRQKGLHWANPVPDGFGGSSFDAPEEITCRWEEKQEQYITKEGETKISKAIVYVDRDMKVGEYLRQGELIDLDSDQSIDSESFIIMAFSKTPDMSGTSFLRKVWL